MVLFLLVSVLVWVIARRNGEDGNAQTNPNTSKETEIPITDSLIEKIRNETEVLGYFSDFYDRASAFDSLADYLKTGEKYGKLEEIPSSAQLAKELGSIGSGKIINIMAPVRTYSQTGIEDAHVPFMSIKKEGDNVVIVSLGNYWDILQDNLKALDLNSDSASVSEIEKLLEKKGTLDEGEKPFAFLDKNRIDAFSGTSGRESLRKILNDLSFVFSGEIDEEKNNGDRVKEDRLSEQLKSLIVNNPEVKNSDRHIAEIITAVGKQSGNLFLESEEENNFWGTAEARCDKSGGSWFFDTCNCPVGSELDVNGDCAKDERLKNNCEKNGGSWKATSGSAVAQKVCGGNRYTGNLVSDSQNKFYCQCPQDSCLGVDGSCNQNNEDSDGDGIANQIDNCPTQDDSGDKNVNRDVDSQRLGCNCSQIGIVMKNCPANKCLGSRWVEYSKGEQECSAGELQPYTCNFTDQGPNKYCVGPVQNSLLSLADRSEKGEVESATGTKPKEQSGFPISTEVGGDRALASDSQKSEPGPVAVAQPQNVTGNTGLSSVSGSTGTSTTGGKTHGGIIPGPAEKMPYLPRSNFDWSKILPTVTSISGQQSYGSKNSGAGKAEGLKAALRRIYNQDYQTYKMIFTYLDTIKHKPGGGQCDGCGKARVDFDAPYKVLDQITVHEAAHCAQACTGGFGGFTRRELERIAVEKQIGSAHFEKAIPTNKGNIWDLMEEFPSQRSQFVSYKGFEVRGYLARYWCKASPQGLDCGAGGKDDSNMGGKTLFLDRLLNPLKFIRPVAAYEPRSSKGGEYYYYGVEDGDANWGIYYATESKQVPGPPDTTYGGYPYGFGSAVLGAKQKEEDVIRRFEVMSNQDLYPCMSSPPPDLPPAFGCEGAPTIQLERE